jgi:hypothetical protein
VSLRDTRLVCGASFTVFGVLSSVINTERRRGKRKRPCERKAIVIYYITGWPGTFTSFVLTELGWYAGDISTKGP